MVTMADTGLLAAPAAAAARHSKVQTPPLGVFSSAEDTDSEAEADRTRDEEDDDDDHQQHNHRLHNQQQQRQHQQQQHRRRQRQLQQQQQQQPVCLAARSNASATAAVISHNINNNNNNINNNHSSTRNKRKNFQPRNISYTQDAAEDGGDGGAGGDSAAAGGDSSTAAAVLDLSACTGSTVAKRPRVDDGSAPMDLTCAVPQPPNQLPPAGAVPADKRPSTVAAAAAAAAHGVQHLLAAAAAAAGHHGHHQPHDATDLKEYAQNTVRELLEIYGLNTDVADAITNNVPMVNFSTGKSRVTVLYMYTGYNDSFEKKILSVGGLGDDWPHCFAGLRGTS